MATLTARLLLVMSVLAGLLSARVRPSADDRARLESLERQYGHKYEFALGGSLYLRVIARGGGHPPESEMRDVYRAFVRDERGKRRNTTFVYLNVYDARRQFGYQLVFDPQTGRFYTNDTEYYEG